MKLNHNHSTKSQTVCTYLCVCVCWHTIMPGITKTLYSYRSQAYVLWTAWKAKENLNRNRNELKRFLSPSKLSDDSLILKYVCIWSFTCLKNTTPDVPSTGIWNRILTIYGSLSYGWHFALYDTSLYHLVLPTISPHRNNDLCFQYRKAQHFLH